jgi:hypothetical protein
LSTYLQNKTLNFVSKTKIYFICGDSEGDPDMVPDMQVFHQNTMKKGFTQQQVNYEVVAGGKHSESSWATQISRVYEFLFPLENNATAVQNTKEEITEFHLTSSAQNLIIDHKGLKTNLKQLNLYNLSGRLIFSESFSKRIIVENVQKGFYLCVIEDGNRKIWFQKIVI